MFDDFTKLLRIAAVPVDLHLQAIASIASARMRSKTSHEAWYRRNAGEYAAWRNGQKVDPRDRMTQWHGKQGRWTVLVSRSAMTWLIVAHYKLIGNWGINVRKGYEVDSVFTNDGDRSWLLIDVHDLRAPVTWSAIPGKKEI